MHNPVTRVSVRVLVNNGKVTVRLMGWRPGRP